jgi:transcriptional regulator of acetoin/glycerol metabolism
VRGGTDGEARSDIPERERLVRALERSGWNRSRAARILGMHRTTVWRKMREHGIEEPEI